MPETPDAIADLLRQADRCQPAVREFAWVWLETFRRDAAELLADQRREGRLAAMADGDVEAVRQRTEARLQEARELLLGRLQRLLAWARESGRGEADGTVSNL
jgi:hypothetical protein